MGVPSDRAPTVEELIECLHDVVAQSTYKEDTTWVNDADHPAGIRIVRTNPRYESDFISAYADGLAMLGRLGRVRVIEDGGRWVKAVPIDSEDNPSSDSGEEHHAR